MKSFSRDILIVDFEVTKFDIEKGEPIQIGLILLDKNTLETKWSYSSWIQPKQPVSLEQAGLRWASLDQNDLEEIKKAPDLVTVAKKIVEYLDAIGDPYAKTIVFCRTTAHAERMRSASPVAAACAINLSIKA